MSFLYIASFTSYKKRLFRDPLREFLEVIGGQLERLELNHLENIDRQLIVQVAYSSNMNRPMGF
jgi:hypothetical protein